MDFWVKILKFLSVQMSFKPELYGSFHIISIALSLLLGIALCMMIRKDKNPETVRRTVFMISAFVLFTEIVKQVLYSVSFTEAGLVWEYGWYTFPFQFCAMPMYLGVLQGIFKKGKIHDALCAFLATYAIFAGVCVMIYPSTVFSSTFFYSFQTMLCHGTMLPIGVFLMFSGHVKLRHKTILKAMAVFAVCLTSAVVLNEVMYYSGILGDQRFNMFFVSRHYKGDLPIYSEIHEIVPFPLNLLIYFAGFSLIAYIILLIAMGVQKLASLGKKKENTI